MDEKQYQACYEHYRNVILSNLSNIKIAYSGSNKALKLDAIKNFTLMKDAEKSLGLDTKKTYRVVWNFLGELKQNGISIPKPNVSIVSSKGKSVNVVKKQVSKAPKQKTTPTEKKQVVTKKENNGLVYSAEFVHEPTIENKPEEIVEKTSTHKVDMSDFIPKKNQKYIPRKIMGVTDIDLLSSIYDNRMKEKKHLMLVGETGSGKTHLARELAFKKKLPYARINLNGATTPDDLVGQFVPNPNGGNAKYVWKDGLLTNFMRYGGLLVIDEMNMANADILGILNSVLDDERRLTITQKDSECVIAHDDFFVIVTMNPDTYEGTKPLNIALRDRFKVMEIDYNSVVEKKLKLDKRILKVATEIRKSDYIQTPLSTRTLISFQDDVEMYGDKVARMFFCNAFDDKERAVVNEIISLNYDSNDNTESDNESENNDDE